MEEEGERKSKERQVGGRRGERKGEKGWAVSLEQWFSNLSYLGQRLVRGRLWSPWGRLRSLCSIHLFTAVFCGWNWSSSSCRTIANGTGDFQCREQKWQGKGEDLRSWLGQLYDLSMDDSRTGCSTLPSSQLPRSHGRCFPDWRGSYPWCLPRCMES